MLNQDLQKYKYEKHRPVCIRRVARKWVVAFLDHNFISCREKVD